jgi:hypothetical protein
VVNEIIQKYEVEDQYVPFIRINGQGQLVAVMPPKQEVPKVANPPAPPEDSGDGAPEDDGEGDGTGSDRTE